MASGGRDEYGRGSPSAGPVRQPMETPTCAVEVYDGGNPDSTEIVRGDLNNTISQRDTSTIAGPRHLLSGDFTADALVASFLNQIESRFARIEDRIQRLEDRVQRLEGEFRARRGEIQWLEGEFRARRGEIQRLEGKTQWLEGEFRARRGEIQRLEGKTQWLEGNVQILTADRQNRVKREVVCGLYIAIGHRDDSPRLPTFRWLCQQKRLLEKVFWGSPQQIEDLLEFMDPGSRNTLGCDTLHQYSLADALAAVGRGEQLLRAAIGFLIARYGESACIYVAAHKLRKHLARSYPELAEFRRIQKGMGGRHCRPCEPPRDPW